MGQVVPLVPAPRGQLTDQVKHLFSISRELNGERDIPRLLGLILSKAREVTGADAGSLYVAESAATGEKNETVMLRFRAAQNDSMPQPLLEGLIPVDESTVVGSVFLKAQPLNLSGLYNRGGAGAHPGHSHGWDTRTGYECHSLLTVPIFDISRNVIGIIQLINRKKERSARLLKRQDFLSQILPFDADDEQYALVVAQQAGIALENAILANNLQGVFEGMVHASIAAIEQRDPTTSGHSHRVAQLTRELAIHVNHVSSGPYANVSFSRDELKEIEYASLLHDFGKLGVREQVLVKAKKLYPWQLDNVNARFELARAAYEISYLRACLKEKPGTAQIELKWREDLAKLNEMFAAILAANEPTVLPEGSFELLKDIASTQFLSPEGRVEHLLQPEELKALSVKKGSLTPGEFEEIKSHVTHTYNFLRIIPWGHGLRNVPEIAAKHHEKLDGSGYPYGVKAREIPVQSRIMAISDIFDALTASDRPYKKAMPVGRALELIRDEVNGGKLDADLFRIFCETKVYGCLVSLKSEK